MEGSSAPEDSAGWEARPDWPGWNLLEMKRVGRSTARAGSSETFQRKENGDGE